MKRALYIGKFQPFHIGHLDIVKNIDRAPDIDEIVIAVGSSQWNHQNRDPERPWLDNLFTVQEREAVIEASLRPNISKPFHIVPILDFLPKWDKESTPRWFDGIVRRCPEFHCLYTNRRRAAELFSQAGFETRPNPLGFNFSATVIREKMALGDHWQPLVAPAAVRIIEALAIEQRARNLFAKVDIWAGDHPGLAWEWRTFARVKPDDIRRIIAMPVFRDEEILDRYLFSLLRTSVNFKLRENGFKVKKLLTMQDGLEAWESFEADFPMERDWLLEGCRDIKFPMPTDGLPETITEANLMARVDRGWNPYVFLLSLPKRRYMRLFQEHGIRCGVDVTVFYLPRHNEAITTIGLEAETKEWLEAALQSLGLKDYPAMNYMQFLEKFVLKEAGNDIWKTL